MICYWLKLSQLGSESDSASGSSSFLLLTSTLRGCWLSSTAYSNSCVFKYIESSFGIKIFWSTLLFSLYSVDSIISFTFDDYYELLIPEFCYSSASSFSLAVFPVILFNVIFFSQPVVNSFWTIYSRSLNFLKESNKLIAMLLKSSSFSCSIFFLLLLSKHSLAYIDISRVKLFVTFRSFQTTTLAVLYFSFC